MNHVVLSIAVVEFVVFIFFGNRSRRFSLAILRGDVKATHPDVRFARRRANFITFGLMVIICMTVFLFAKLGYL